MCCKIWFAKLHNKVCKIEFYKPYFATLQKTRKKSLQPSKKKKRETQKSTSATSSSLKPSRYSVNDIHDKLSFSFTSLAVALAIFFEGFEVDSSFFSFTSFAIALAVFFDGFEVEDIADLILILILPSKSGVSKWGPESKSNRSGGVMIQGLGEFVLRGVEGVDGGLNNGRGWGSTPALTFDSLALVAPVGRFDLSPVVCGSDILRTV
jgi:hypothetical protein